MEDDYGSDEAICLIMIYEMVTFSPTPSPQQIFKGLVGSAPSVKNAVVCQKTFEMMQQIEMKFLRTL